MPKTKSVSKKVFVIILAMCMLFAVSNLAPITAQAASGQAFKLASTSTPIKSYILSKSNIACYTSSSLSTRGTVTAGASSTAYIAPSDDVYIIQADTTNLKWFKVTYPVGSSRYTAYIAISALTSNNSSHKKTTASAKVMTYKRADSSTGVSSMYIDKGDAVYLVAVSGSYYQVVYPCSGGWRMAWVTKSNYDKYLSVGTQTQSSFTYPMKNYSTKYTQWGVKVSYMSSSRNYHCGVDFISDSDKNVYSIGAGSVATVGTNSANGKYVVIKHTISGKTVYSFYAHLSSYSVSKGASVSKGTKIGVVGSTGSASNGIVHLHFAIVDTLWSGSYYGYTPAFSGNKVSYSGVTYYNPYYVIANGKLPS